MSFVADLRDTIQGFHFADRRLSQPGAAPRGDWGQQFPLFLTKVIFVNRPKLLRKYWGDGGDDFTNHTLISV